MKKHIIIAGCPATGKKTIAANLSKILKVPYLEYSSFLMSANAASIMGNDIIIDESKAEEALDGLRGRHIIAGTYALRLVDPQEVISAIVIRCNPFVLSYRYLMRNYDLKKIRENLTAEFIDSCLAEAFELLGDENVMQIDSTFETPESAAIRIGNALKSGSSLFDEVDWLSHIRNPKQLKMMI